jgi:AraC-like DNA-binding protein
MKVGKLYLDPDLTLAKLAESAAIPAKHLSQIINERYELNFNDFINRQRVEEAKRKLVDPAAREFKLLRIAFESGFNSKSVFNSAFRKSTGLSPSEFRKLLGDGAANGDS